MSGESAPSAPCGSSHLFHLIQEHLWHEAQARGSAYYPPTYNEDGFTHLTQDPALLLGVANHFYKGIGGNWLLLVLDADKLTSPVKFEPAAPVGTTSAFGDEKNPNEPLFPHLYGPIDLAAAVRELLVHRDSEGTFTGIQGLEHA